MSERPSEENRQRSPWRLLAPLLLLLLLLTAAALLARGGCMPRGNALSALPQPEPGAPQLYAHATRGEFPLHVSRLMADSPTISPNGGSPVNALLPLFALAGESAVVITERENGLALYGAYSASRKEQAALGAGKIPASWEAYLEAPEATRTTKGGPVQIRAANLLYPLYVEANGKYVFLADSLNDMQRIAEVRSGGLPGIGQKWSAARDWGGHAYMSDGGVIAGMLSDGDGAFPEPASVPLSLEIAWQTGTEGGEVQWRAGGLENLLDGATQKKLKSFNWSQIDPFVPDPLILAAGLHLPDPGKNLSALASLLKFPAEQLQRLGLKNGEVQSLLTGPAVISLGGRTQILWFELPGIVLDIPARGKTAYRLIDRFWSELFMGAEPKPIPGYSHGGTTDLPFTVLAAANDKKAVVGLSTPDATQNEEVKNLLTEVTGAIGWFFADFPKLGTVLAEMPSINSLLYEDEDRPIDNESTTLVREALSRLGRVLVVWESGAKGRAVWYH